VHKMRRQVSIPDPIATVESLHATVVALKELVETLAGQRNSQLDTAVTYEDLLHHGLIAPDQVPNFRGEPSG
jgi:hypothetical protein